MSQVIYVINARIIVEYLHLKLNWILIKYSEIKLFV